MKKLPDGADPVEVFLRASKMMDMGHEEPRSEALRKQSDVGKVMAYLVRAASDPAEAQKIRRELILRGHLKNPKDFELWFRDVVELSRRELREADVRVNRVVFGSRVIRPAVSSKSKGRIWPKPKHRK